MVDVSACAADEVLPVFDHKEKCSLMIRRGKGSKNTLESVKVEVSGKQSLLLSFLPSEQVLP